MKFTLFKIFLMASNGQSLALKFTFGSAESKLLTYQTYYFIFFPNRKLKRLYPPYLSVVFTGCNSLLQRNSVTSALVYRVTAHDRMRD